MNQSGNAQAAARENRKQPCAGSFAVTGTRGSQTRASASPEEARICARPNARGAWKKIESIRGLQLQPPNTGYN